jgi:hypothetical protein
MEIGLIACKHFANLGFTHLPIPIKNGSDSAINRRIEFHECQRDLPMPLEHAVL